MGSKKVPEIKLSNKIQHSLKRSCWKEIYLKSQWMKIIKSGNYCRLLSPVVQKNIQISTNLKLNSKQLEKKNQPLMATKREKVVVERYPKKIHLNPQTILMM